MKSRAALLASIVDSAAAAIISKNLDGIVTSWNRAAEALYGYKEEEIVGRPFSILEGKGPPDQTTRVKKNGTTSVVSPTVSPIHDALGKVIGASSIERDVSESNLRESLLQSSIKYSIIGKDLEHRIVSWNEGARRNYGYSADEIIGKSSEVLHSPEDLASGAVEKLLEAARLTGLAEGEFQRVRKDGSRFTASVVITRRTGPGDAHIGYLVMSSDVSAQKVAEQKLRFASQYARSLIEASLDPHLTIAATGEITDTNEATIRATGVERGALIGTDFSQYFTEPKVARDAYEQALAVGSVTDVPMTIRHRNGRLIEVLYNASVYKGELGNVLGVFASARDVTAQTRATVELAEQRARDLDRLAELERFQRLTVGRELKMIELKKEIAALRAGAGNG